MTLFYCRKQARAAIELTGEEVGSFLNDILTAELNSLPIGEMQMSCLLSPQGRILHDMLIFRIRENCFWLEVGNNQILELKKSFEMYRLRKFITIKILENWSSFHFFHIDGKAFSSEQIKEIQAKLDDNELIFRDPRSSALGLHTVKNGDIDRKLNPNWKNTDLANWDKIRISNMVPLGNTDLTPNRALMLEANLDMFSAVDFNKGCFIGQEVTARTKYRGLVKKKLVPISSSAPLREGMIIFQENKKVGICHSTVKLKNESYLALASLRLDAIKYQFDSKKQLRSSLALITIQLPYWYDFKNAIE